MAFCEICTTQHECLRKGRCFEFESEERGSEEIKREDKALQRLFDAADRTMDSCSPCFTCSNSGGFMVPGETERINGLQISRTLKDSLGHCSNCKHITTLAERNILIQRREEMLKLWKERLS